MNEQPLHEFSATLMRWFAENGRDLPWRHTRDPYAVWLSEVILQQTRVAQGQAYWERFMQRFPAVDDLAEASEDEVLRLWQGLGYYSRARNLHHAARQIVENGGFPDTFDALRRLKGVGDYTAAAVGSIAFGLPVAVVDGNVYRVLARYFGIDTPINGTEGKKLFAALADSLLPHAYPDRCKPRGICEPASPSSIYNQAIMDFGALVCTPASPGCNDCPLSAHCEAWHARTVSVLPVKLKTTKVKTRRMVYVYIRCNGQTVIRKRSKCDIWQGLWEPFVVELHENPAATKSLSASVTSVSAPQPASVCMPDEAEWFALLPPEMRSLPLTLLRKGVKHVLTHRIIMADFYLLETPHRLSLPADYRYIDECDIDDYGKPRLFELLLEALSAMQ